MAMHQAQPHRMSQIAQTASTHGCLQAGEAGKDEMEIAGR
jgi:hypothetical protein